LFLVANEHSGNINDRVLDLKNSLSKLVARDSPAEVGKLKNYSDPRFNELTSRLKKSSKARPSSFDTC
jgi:hypothetical protein